jgi:hypothetical protein
VGRAFRPGVVRVGDLPIAERASRESERGRGVLSCGPRTRWGTVEAFRRGCLVRVGVGTRSRRPVELALYESESVRGRGVPSAIFWLCCVCALMFRSFLSLIMGTLVGTDT